MLPSLGQRYTAVNRQEVFLPFEEEMWGKEALPSPGSRGAYLSDPQRAPLVPSPPPTHLSIVFPGLGFFPSGGWEFHCASCLHSRSTVWPSLLSYFICIKYSKYIYTNSYIYMCFLCFLGLILSHPPFLWRAAGAEGAAGARFSGPQSVHIPPSPLAHHSLWHWDTWGAPWEVRTLS